MHSTRWSQWFSARIWFAKNSGITSCPRQARFAVVKVSQKGDLSLAIDGHLANVGLWEEDNDTERTRWLGFGLKTKLQDPRAFACLDACPSRAVGRSNGRTRSEGGPDEHRSGSGVRQQRGARISGHSVRSPACRLTPLDPTATSRFMDGTARRNNIRQHLPAELRIRGIRGA